MRKVESRDPDRKISPADDRLMDDDLREDDRLMNDDLRDDVSGIPGSERERADGLSAAEARRDRGGASVGGEASVPPRGQPEDGSPLELFDEPSRQELRSRWESIQAGFVDEPRRSVEEADRLVDDTTKRLSEGFAKVRNDLEEEWKRGEDVSTEDLRRAFRRYRSFFDRLVST